MPYIERLFKPSKLLAKKSFFLFGPRGTGKSYLLRHDLKSKDVFSLSLLDSSLYLRLHANPSLLKVLILNAGKKI